MTTWHTRIEIQATAEEVWKTLVDFPKAQLWNPNVKSAQITTPGPLGRGSQITTKSGGRETLMRLEEYVPGQRLVASFHTGGTMGRSEFVLRPDGSTTVMEHTLDIEFRGIARLFSIFVGNSLKKEFAAMKRYIEHH